jgi:parallel beta-helix repeat protein
MSRVRALLLVAVVLLLTANLALAANFAVGTCKPSLPSYSTISAAVSGVPPGSTIEVCPGTYAEQVTIAQALTLKGIASGNTSDVIIAVPGSGLTTITDDFGYVLAPQVEVTAGPVNISNITVDGTGNTVSGASIVGVFYGDGSSGIVNEITSRFQEHAGGYDAGVWVSSASSATTVTIENSSFHDIDNSSVLAIGGSVNLTVKGNTMEATGYNAQLLVSNLTASANVIVGNGCCWGMNVVGLVAGTVSGNTVDNNLWGIYVQPSGSSLDVTKNKISNAQIGINLLESSDTYKGNLITRTGVGIEFNCNSPAVSTNTINDATTGLNDVPSTFSSTNTFNSVGTIRSGSCAEARQAPKSGKMPMPMPSPKR